MNLEEYLDRLRILAEQQRQLRDQYPKKPDRRR